MATTEVTINGRAYRLACDDGQEAHLAALAVTVDQRIRNTLRGAPQMGEIMALVLASLMLADEVHDLKAEVQSRGPKPKTPPLDEDALTHTLNQIAERLEVISDYVEMK